MGNIWHMRWISLFELTIAYLYIQINDIYIKDYQLSKNAW